VDIVLRRVEHAEHSAIADLWVESWRVAMPQIDFDARRAWFADRLQTLEKDGATILCACEGSFGPPLGFLTIDTKTGWLDQLVVSPRVYGGGVASFLLDAAKQLAPERIKLDVNQDNARALRFYTREGFCRRGEGVNPRSGLKTWILEWRRAPIEENNQPASTA